MRGATVVGTKNPHAADQNGHLSSRQAQELCAVQHHRLRRYGVFLQLPVTEPIGERLQNGEALRICLRVRRITTTRRKGHSHVKASSLDRLFQPNIPGQHDDIRD